MLSKNLDSPYSNIFLLLFSLFPLSLHQSRPNRPRIDALELEVVQRPRTRCHRGRSICLVGVRCILQEVVSVCHLLLSVPLLPLLPTAFLHLPYFLRQDLSTALFFSVVSLIVFLTQCALWEDCTFLLPSYFSFIVFQ